jgi:hypothetical protein
MKRVWPLLFLFSSMILGQSQSASKARGFTVSLPLNISPETARIFAGFSGQALRLHNVPTRAGAHDYPIDVSNSDPRIDGSLKLLIYIPGYRMVASEFKNSELVVGRVYIPPLVELQTVMVSGRLIDSSSKPIADRSLTVNYSLREARDYYGYIDGPLFLVPIGSVRTDSRGEFTITVPSLLDDPFFRKSRSNGQFELSSENGTIFMDHTLSPSRFAVQKVYEPLIIRKVQKGTLSGKLGKEFLQQIHIPDLATHLNPQDLSPGISLQATTHDGGTTFNANLQVDGSFEAQLPAGEYDLTIWVPEVDEPILVQSGVVVAENKRQVIERPPPRP